VLILAFISNAQYAIYCEQSAEKIPCIDYLQYAQIGRGKKSDDPGITRLRKCCDTRPQHVRLRLFDCKLRPA
jgi:hypothetical protein